MSTGESETFVRVSGPADAPPLVLLPGMHVNSRWWATMIAALSSAYRTYAVDAAYDIGRSVSTRPITEVADVVAWLDKLLDALDLHHDVNIMGMALGSHVAAEYALRSPERLSKIVLLSMAGGVSPLNMIALAPRGFLGFLPPRRRTLRIVTSWMMPYAAHSTGLVREMYEDFVEETVLWAECCRAPAVPNGALRVLSDSELQSYKVPVLYIAGAEERTCSTARAVERLAAVAPAIETAVILDAGHDACWVQSDMVSDRVMRFLAQ